MTCTSKPYFIAIAITFLAAIGLPALSADEPAHVEGGALANPSSRYELPTIEVVSTAPLPGMGVSIDKIPSNVKTLSAKDLEGRGFDNLSDALNSGLGNVNINDTQGNGYQVDVNVRGFTASPSLGTPQGVSVFMDGVRVNEAFGDVVNWDLIPQNAIANITLMPGANPQFGLNTLGGALSVVTKSGFQFPGTRIDTTGGMFGRRQLQIETGGHGETTDYFIATNWYKDSGWADHNPSEVRQLFAKTGFQDDDTDIDLSITAANNVLEGNQTIPLSYMGNTSQVYTYPDQVTNKMWMLNLKASQYLNKDWLVAGNAYYRHVDTSILNSNIVGGDNFTSQDPSCLSASDVSLSTCPNAANIINSINQKSYGTSLQLSDSAPLFGLTNMAMVGLSLDRSRTDFTQSQQAAVVAADRSTFSSSDISLQTSVQGETDYFGLYTSDTLSLSKEFAMTVSGRFNSARVKTIFLAHASGTAGANGDFTYTRLNPAIGFNYNPTPNLTSYVSYTEGMRAPTPVELSCADSSSQCALPNSFASDPYLKKVVSRSLEFGLRGKLGLNLNWSFGAFQTRLQDDIRFINTGASTGYFDNVGDTERRGLEFGLDQRNGAWDWGINYSLIDATFQSSFTELVAANSAADSNGNVNVSAGSHIPGIPNQMLKLRLRYSPSETWSVGWSMNAQTSTYARGDENNKDGKGKVPGFAVFNLDGKYAPWKDWEFSAHVRNIFNRTYSTFGNLGMNYLPSGVFNSTGQAEQFRSIAPPRTVWIGVTYWFDKPQGRSEGAADRD
jgi:outer membrane receptor protein involved in Fe transport